MPVIAVQPDKGPDVQLAAAIIVLLVAVIQPALARSDDPNRLSRCLAEIDSAVALYRSAQTDAATARLIQLQHSCDAVPQLHHNLGVLAAQERDWDSATRHFEQSLQLDHRAAMTQESLSGIYQYRAGLAYQKALKLRRSPELPRFTMQTSRLTNVCPVPPAASTTVHHTMDNNVAAQQSAPEPGVPGVTRETQVTQACDIGVASHKTPPTDQITYDVRSWWTAAREQDDDAYHAHYAQGYPAPIAVTERDLPDFDQARLDLDMIDNIALVTLAVPPAGNNQTPAHAILLVMKHHEGLWQIVSERQLATDPKISHR